MSYEKVGPFQNGGAPPLSAENLDHMETQYDEAVSYINDYVNLYASGLIVMWHGLISNIPAGWIICDGNNGTPNLLGRFVEGVATAETNPGTTGGATAKTTSAPSSTSNPASGGAAPLAASTMHTHTISDIRPLFYDIAFIMKT